MIGLFGKWHQGNTTSNNKIHQPTQKRSDEVNAYRKINI